MTPGAEPPPIWDADQVATYLKVPKATVYAWRHKRIGPPGRRVGRHLRYDANELKEWFRNLESHPADDEPL